MPDPTSQSNYLQIASKHVAFVWSIDFLQKIITGSALHDLIAKQDDVKEVMWAKRLHTWLPYIKGGKFALSFDTADLSVEGVEIEGKSVSVGANCIATDSDSLMNYP